MTKRLLLPVIALALLAATPALAAREINDPGQTLKAAPSGWFAALMRVFITPEEYPVTQPEDF